MAGARVSDLDGEPRLISAGSPDGTRAPRLAMISSQAFSLHNFRGPLIRAFVQKGVRVFALAPDFDETSRAQLQALGAEPVNISMSRVGLNAFRDVADGIMLVRVLKRLSPDATLAYFIKPVIYGSLSAAIAGVPRRFALVPGLGYVFTASGSADSLRRRMLRGVITRMYGAALARCERVIFQNAHDAQWFVRRGLLDPDKVVLTGGTGVDLNVWKPVPVPAGPVAFLLVARLLKEKGIREFADAARLVKAKHPEVRCLLIGGLDPNPGGLKRREVLSWVEEGILEWPGQVSDVRPWIAQASVYVLPSYGEGVPRSTQEAMAMGRPVVTTNAVGCRETVVEGVNGYMVPVGDSIALAQAMERFVLSPELIDAMGRESRRLAEERFDVHRTNEVILNAMGRLDHPVRSKSPSA